MEEKKSRRSPAGTSRKGLAHPRPSFWVLTALRGRSTTRSSRRRRMPPMLSRSWPTMACRRLRSCCRSRAGASAVTTTRHCRRSLRSRTSRTCEPGHRRLQTLAQAALHGAHIQPGPALLVFELHDLRALVGAAELPGVQHEQGHARHRQPGRDRPGGPGRASEVRRCKAGVTCQCTVTSEASTISRTSGGERQHDAGHARRRRPWIAPRRSRQVPRRAGARGARALAHVHARSGAPVAASSAARTPRFGAFGQPRASPSGRPYTRTAALRLPRRARTCDLGAYYLGVPRSAACAASSSSCGPGKREAAVRRGQPESPASVRRMASHRSSASTAGHDQQPHAAHAVVGGQRQVADRRGSQCSATVARVRGHEHQGDAADGQQQP